MSIRDRLYGAIELPQLAQELAESCPVLHRLREVRMANIPFARFPSFANVTRYEHSIGVAHLAWRFARAQELPQDEALALTLAALYHDGATPAFGHLYEEFLITDGFNHEEALVELLTGSDTLYGRYDAQVFLGRRCRLRTKLPLLDDNSLLSCHGIASILAGKHPLSGVIAGSIDLDNIDNVIRAAGAMGLAHADSVHPYEVLDALALDQGRLARTYEDTGAIVRWQAVRRELYAAILANNFEFRSQSAIKWAIALSAVSEPRLAQSASWTLTEPELVFEHLRCHREARDLVDSVRLGSPPRLLARAEVTDVSQLLDAGGGRRLRAVARELGDLLGKPTFINFYLDKGQRTVDLPFVGRHTASDHNTPARPKTHQLPGVVGVIARTGEGPYVRSRHGPTHASSRELAALVIERLALAARTQSDPAPPQQAPEQLAMPA